MKTVHFFAFYPHNLPKITLFAPRSSMNLKIQNLYILMGMGGGLEVTTALHRDEPILS